MNEGNRWRTKEIARAARRVMAHAYRRATEDVKSAAEIVGNDLSPTGNAATGAYQP